MRVLFRNLAWLAIGLLAGIGLGLYLGWVAWPIEFTDADPTLLDSDLQEDYALMIATAYFADGDLATTRWRLATLQTEDVNSWFLAFTVDNILAEKDERDIRYLVHLAHDLGLSSPIMAPYLPQEEIE